jgi:ABC-type glycerol-3-phosphate transport system substrate-binding protein
MKKILSVLSVLVLTAGMTFAGGNQQGASAGGNAVAVIDGIAMTTPKDAKVTLTYWHHQVQAVHDAIAVAQQATDILHQAGWVNASVVAKQIDYSHYMSIYQSAFSAGQGPDLFMAKVSDFAAGDDKTGAPAGANPVSMPLPDSIAQKWKAAVGGLYKTEGWFPAGDPKERFYGPVIAGDTIVLLYINTDMMKKAGVPVDYVPKTCEDFEKLAIKLTQHDASGKITVSGFQPRFVGSSDMVGSKFIPILHNFGGRILDPKNTTAKGYLDSPDSLRAFEFFNKLCNVDKVFNVDFGHPDTAFQQGQAAMTIREPFYAAQTMTKAPNIHFKVVALPTEKLALSTLGSGSWHFMVNSASKYKDLCLLIEDKMCNPAADIATHEPDKIPPILAANISMQNPYYKTLPYAQAMIDSMANPIGPIYDTFAQGTQVQGSVGEAITNVILGKATPQAAIDAAVSKIDTIMSQR